MKKTILILIVFMLWASLAVAEQTSSEMTSEAQSTEADFEGRVGVGYRWMSQSGSPIAGEYDFIKSSVTGALDMEYDPLPHRFVLESYFLNHKDYFGEMDYAYKDVVIFNGYARDMFHNLNHYNLGPASTTPGVSFTDRDPGAEYGIENQMRRAFIRFKTPDFPLHLYAEVITVDREGTIQQRFLNGSSGLDIVSQSRDIDWNTQQVRVGANSHLGLFEVDYSHTEKKFEVIANQELFDVTPHNLTPDLKSSSDTVKIHSSYSGRLVMAGAYTSGDKKNEDSAAKVKFWNTAEDVTFMPVTSVILAVKYRHYNTDASNPDAVTLTGTTVVNVRDAISSSRDVVTGTIRYRATDRLTLKGEYLADTTDRERGTLGTSLPAPPAGAEAFWDVPERTTKGTGKLGLIYRVMNKVTLRADYSRTTVDNPAYDTDPDKSQSARASITWMPTPRFSTLLSYSLVRETRDLLGAPLAGGTRDAARDQGLASFTMLVGNRSSITVSYAYFKNKVDQTVTLTDGTTPPSTILVPEPGVPYEDVAHVGSIILAVAPVDGVNLTASGSRSYSRGNFNLEGAGPVTNTTGIAGFSDMKVIDTVYAAGIEMQHSKYVSSELRYQYRRYDDQIDDTQDGTVRTVLATLSMKW
ncbi:MAG TPA: hypothetical protein VLN91_04120 [Nitrospirota bacterium]|nr:hypothetical protein [Nitrospirota bacterium]